MNLAEVRELIRHELPHILRTDKTFHYIVREMQTEPSPPFFLDIPELAGYNSEFRIDLIRPEYEKEQLTMQALKIQKRIDSEILYLHLPEFRDMIGKNVEIIILPGSEKESEKKDRLLSKDAYASKSSYREQPATSGTGCENRQLLETINAAYDDMPEDRMLLSKMRHSHRRLIMEDGQW